MPDRTSESEISEALSAFREYLSDSVAPLLAADSVLLLLNHPAQLMASRIESWVGAQYRGKGASVPVSDYLFHAMKKLHTMGQLKLVPEEPLARYLDQVAQIILDYCPDEDREMLRENLQLLGQADTILSSPISVVYQQKGTKRPLASQREAGKEPGPGFAFSEDVARASRRFALLLERLGRGADAPLAAIPAVAEKRTELLSHVFEDAIDNSQTSEEFRQYQDLLKHLGMEAATDQVFRTLSRSLPGWVAPVAAATTGETAQPYQSPAVEAMRQIIRLADDARESGKRFQEMVKAAIERFNEGSLAQAVTMFDLAENLISETKVDPDAVKNIRSTEHQSLDSNRLRAWADNTDKHHLLQRVLNFFYELSPPSLLDSLQREAKRERRRLILSLLEVHGAAARKAAFERLDAFLGSTRDSHEWYYPRNLLYLLHRIPRPDDSSLEKEIELVARLFKPEYPAPLVREAIVDLGQMKHEKAEQALIAGLHQFEEILLRPNPSPYDPAKLRSLLDRTVSTLARLGTPNAYQAVVDHGLRQLEELGNTLSRLAYLAGQDLSVYEEIVERLVKALKSEIPFKLLGFLVQKNAQKLKYLIKALSTTPAAEVRRVFEVVVKRFPGQEFSKLAAKALKRFDSSVRSEEASAERFAGDLELFGLPDLLQRLANAQVTGALTLKDQRTNPYASVSLQEGKMLNCQVRLLQGEDALCQLLERPIPGTFVFMSKPIEELREDGETHPPRDLIPIILEGMRRHDEFQRFCALVPDGISLKPTGVEATPPASEQDRNFFRYLWIKASAGAIPEECEAEIVTDAYRIRRLLAHWVEEGSLELK